MQESLKNREHIKIFKADLSNKDTLCSALENVNVAVHFAGVLFKENSEKFFPQTNTKYFENLFHLYINQVVKRIILITFPHAENKTMPQKLSKNF